MRHSKSELMKTFKEAIIRYEMLSDDSPILVGLSGGKDSMALLYILKEFQRISKYKYPLYAGHIDLGFSDDYPQILEDYCKSIDVPFIYERTDIGKIVFDIRKESSPCSLCAKMRRGALNTMASKHNIHKLALGHHLDDAVETLIMKTFYEGNIGCFNPVTYLDKRDVTVIRPFIFTPEEVIASVARSADLPVLKNPCPADGTTNRQEIKDMLRIIDKKDAYAKQRAVHALDRLFGVQWDNMNKKTEQQT